MNAVNPNKSPAAGRHTRSPVVSASSSSSNSASGATDDYAFCKIFVGGLHYDTRDGEPNVMLSVVVLCCHPLYILHLS